MKNLRRVGLTLAVTLVLGLSVSTGYAQAPCVPGETMTPPCASAPATLDDSAAPGETSGPPAESSVNAFTISEVAVDLLLSWLF